MPSRKRPTPEQLKAISHHLWYEICTLANLLFLSSDNADIRNALVEARVIHTRNIIVFLYNIGRERHGDVFASDYFDDPLFWQTTRTEMTELLEKALRRAHKEVAHLTLDRLVVTLEEKKWPFIEISEQLAIVLGEFLSAVRPEYMSDDWRNTSKEAGKISKLHACLYLP